jgi:hypothetical protein
VETFDAAIIEADRGGAFVRVPDEVVAALGGTGRIPVRATFDGLAYRGSVVSMGGAKVLGLLKSIRAELGKQPGDTVTVTVAADTDDRTVTVPDDLRAALERSGLQEAFGALSFSRRREHVRWIEEAKRPETRAGRIDKTVERLRTGS